VAGELSEEQYLRADIVYICSSCPVVDPETSVVATREVCAIYVSYGCEAGEDLD